MCICNSRLCRPYRLYYEFDPDVSHYSETHGMLVGFFCFHISLAEGNVHVDGPFKRSSLCCNYRMVVFKIRLHNKAPMLT